MKKLFKKCFFVLLDYLRAFFLSLYIGIRQIGSPEI